MGNTMSSSSSESTAKRLATVAGLLVTGAVFGLCLNKAGVYRAEVIRAQYSFTNFWMMRVFLSAAATSTLSIAGLNALGMGSKLEGSSVKYVGEKRQGIASIILGASMLGIGMAVSAACPGTIYAQIGAGSWRSMSTFAGAVLGAAAYLIAEPKLKKFKLSKRLSVPTLPSLTGLSPTVTATGLAAMMAGVALATESFPENWFYRGLPLLPANRPGAVALLDKAVWSPYLTGAIIGLTQVPLALIAEKNLGTSTTFAVYVSYLASPIYKAFGYDLSVYKGWSKLWQVVFVLGAVGGSMSSMVTGGTPFYDAMSVVSLTESLVGGFLMSAGARIAGGCTSGHGITGMGFQGMNSMIAVASMFGAGGIVTRIFL